MKIDTDRVKNKKFTEPIKANILKHSQEYRVLATLRYLFPTKYKTMITGEAPDIQDTVNSVGIEVTAAVKENDMKVSRAFSEMCQNEEKGTEKQKKIINSSGYSFIPIKNDKVAISTMGISDGEKIFFQESIKRKIKKLQQYRSAFDIMGLAVLLPEIPTSEAESLFIDWIKEVFQKYEDAFDFVYVISHRFYILYDAKRNSSEKHSISTEEDCLLRTIARMTAEEELSLKDQEWN